MREVEDDGRVLGPMTPWTEKDLEIVDLGNAAVETKQCAPAAFVPDSTFQWGTHSWPGYPGQCEGPWG
jgi:hypothetical protein